MPAKMNIGQEEMHGREIAFERERFSRGHFCLLEAVEAIERLAKQEVADPGSRSDLKAVPRNFLRVAILLALIEQFAEGEVCICEILAAQFDRSPDGFLRFLCLTEVGIGKPDLQV